MRIGINAKTIRIFSYKTGSITWLINPNFRLIFTQPFSFKHKKDKPPILNNE